MADTCIVCLGDLAAAADALAVSDSRLKHETLKHETTVSSREDPSISTRKAPNPANSQQGQSEIIAHLLPCGHDLHNECLKPWVERANSCPICRQNFNIVELKSSLEGPCLNSYVVQDKRQVADLDPSMIIDDDVLEEPSIEPCLLCEHFGDEEVLLLCDGCCGSCHTYCAGLSSVPAGPWFCQFCVDDPTVQFSAQGRIRPRRTRGPQWRLGSRLDQSSDAWARVWQSVWDNLNIDLDFPFNEDPELSLRTQHQRREFSEWQQRFRVAESHGAGAATRFRDSAATLLEGRPLRGRDLTPHPESQEEISAWNAFDKAREIESTNSSGPQARNKRKSAPTSPAEPHTEPERKLKRPRTRRAREAREAAFPSSALSVSRREASHRMASAQAATPGTLSENDTGGPSFFQSLLKEVETTPNNLENADLRLQSLNTALATSTDHSSPCSSSPPSSHPSPHLRPISPPPLRSSRPSSPPLTSRIEPIFAQQPRFSPFSPDSRRLSDSEEHSADCSQSAQDTLRRHRPPSRIQTDQTAPANADSPAREQIRHMKAEIQRMVSAALKPAFKKNEIDSDQFTGINRDISRKLYDKVGDAGTLGDGAEREKWQLEAIHQVDEAVKRLKENTELQVMT